MYLGCAVAHGQAHIASPRLHSGSNIGQHHIRLISFSFQVHWPSHSRDMAIWKFNLEKSKSKFIGKVKSKDHYGGSNNRPTCIPFIQCQSALTFLGCGYLTIWPWESKVKIIAQGHIVVQHPFDLHPFCAMSIYPPIPEIQLLKTWPWKSTVKVPGEVKVQGHKFGLTSCWLTSLSFHINQPSRSRGTDFSKFDLQNPMSR